MLVFVAIFLFKLKALMGQMDEQTDGQTDGRARFIMRLVGRRVENVGL